ncbi:MAG: addiction module antidote protein [Cyanobacteria bacterium P01_F01_bin.150]
MNNTRPYDSAHYLETKEDIAYYLEACFEEDAEDPEFIAEAFRTIARAKCFEAIAQETGLSREAFTQAGGPSCGDIAKLFVALELKVRAIAA